MKHCQIYGAVSQYAGWLQNSLPTILREGGWEVTVSEELPWRLPRNTKLIVCINAKKAIVAALKHPNARKILWALEIEIPGLKGRRGSFFLPFIKFSGMISNSLRQDILQRVTFAPAKRLIMRLAMSSVPTPVEYERENAAVVVGNPSPIFYEMIEKLKLLGIPTDLMPKANFSLPAPECFRKVVPSSGGDIFTDVQYLSRYRYGLIAYGDDLNGLVGPSQVPFIYTAQKYPTYIAAGLWPIYSWLDFDKAAHPHGISVDEFIDSDQLRTRLANTSPDPTDAQFSAEERNQILAFFESVSN